MAERIQLKDPGSELHMVVASVTPQTVERNEYFLFTNGKVELLVPQSSVKAQLERMGIPGAVEMIGKAVRFGRSTKMSRANKPFWDIDWSSGAENGSTPAASAVTGVSAGSVSQPVAAEPHDKPRLDRLYLRATKLIIEEVVPLYTKAGIGCSDTAVAAMAATLFIAASKVESQ